MEKFARVKISSGQVVLAGVGVTDGDVEIGTLEEPTLAAGGDASVRLKTAYGTRKMVAAGAIAAGAVFYGAASGRISATASGIPAGIALEASAAAGDIVECILFNQRSAA